MTCEICGTQKPIFEWTDVHGVAQCGTCGVTYTVLHYKGEHPDRIPVNKPPEITTIENYIPMLKAFWKTKKSRIPCSMNFGANRGSLAEIQIFNQFFNEWKANHESATIGKLEVRM